MSFFSKLSELFSSGKNDYSRDPGGYYKDSFEPAANSRNLIQKKKRKQWFSFGSPKDIYHRHLNMKPSTAFFLIKEIESGKAYFEKNIQREGKTPRKISIPAPFLKNVQRRILKRVLEQIDIHDAAHGFVKHRSIFTAVEHHTSKRVVIVIDIRNFFDTITSKRVYGIFKANTFEAKDAAALTKLCCYKNRLPQGAPTSPAIANIICKRLDSRLAGLVSKKGFAYTRYADDLIFSGDQSIIRFIPLFNQIIKEEGFEVAEEKFRIMRSGSRQRVLGLNLNSKVSVPRKVRRIIRAMVHRQLTSGELDESMLDFLYGHVGLMASAHPSQARKLKRKLNKIRKKHGLL